MKKEEKENRRGYRLLKRCTSSIPVLRHGKAFPCSHHAFIRGTTPTSLAVSEARVISFLTEATLQYRLGIITGSSNIRTQEEGGIRGEQRPSGASKEDEGVYTLSDIAGSNIGAQEKGEPGGR